MNAGEIASAHRNGLQAAGTFTYNYTRVVRGTGEELGANRGGRVNLDSNTAFFVSHPTDDATSYTYAEGTTAYEKEVLAGFDEPSYEVKELGQPLAESLVSGRIILETIRAVEYERAGTITRDGERLVVYVANGTDSIAADRLYPDEELSEFSSTLVLDPETGVVRLLRTERTTDKDGTGEPVTVTETLRFSNVGTTTVEQPGWVERLKNGSDDT